MIVIKRQVIRAALSGFLELLETADEYTSIALLELWLGQLAFLQHFVSDVPENESAFFIQPAGDDGRWRRLIAERFPMLGCYDLPVVLSTSTGQPEAVASDSVDDLAQIAREISESLRRWENLGEEHALCYFRSGYQRHWGTRLRNLQGYLHDLQ